MYCSIGSSGCSSGLCASSYAHLVLRFLSHLLSPSITDSAGDRILEPSDKQEFPLDLKIVFGWEMRCDLERLSPGVGSAGGGAL